MSVHDDELQTYWRQLRGGQIGALGNLYDHFYAPLYRFALFKCRDQGMAADVVQDLFLELWERRAKLPEVSQIGAYLRTIALRKLYQRMEELQGTVSMDKLEASFDLATVESYESLLIELQGTEAQRERLRKSLDKLSDKQRMVVFYRFFHGMGYDEIAQKTGTQPRTVYNQVYEAMRILRDCLFVALLWLWK